MSVIILLIAAWAGYVTVHSWPAVILITVGCILAEVLVRLAYKGLRAESWASRSSR